MGSDDQSRQSAACDDDCGKRRRRPMMMRWSRWPFDFLESMGQQRAAVGPRPPNRSNWNREGHQSTEISTKGRAWLLLVVHFLLGVRVYTLNVQRVNARAGGERLVRMSEVQGEASQDKKANATKPTTPELNRVRSKRMLLPSCSPVDCTARIRGHGLLRYSRGPWGPSRPLQSRNTRRDPPAPVRR